MSFEVSASKMEVEVEAEPYGAINTFLNDANKLLWFIKRYNNTIPEYIRIARMYLFGTPIRRTGAAFRRATPGYVSFSISSLLSARYDLHSAGASDSSSFRADKKTVVTRSSTTRSTFRFRRLVNSTCTA